MRRIYDFLEYCLNLAEQPVLSHGVTAASYEEGVGLYVARDKSYFVYLSRSGHTYMLSKQDDTIRFLDKLPIAIERIFECAISKLKRTP